VSRNNLVFKESATIENNGDENIVKSILERNDLEIKKREEMIRNMESELRTIKSKEIPYRQIAEEILAQHPGMVSFSIGRGADVSLKDFNAMEQIVVLASWSKRLPDAEIEKLEKWLSVRMNEKNLRVVQVK
jgi:transcriptional regulator NrdR family protein